MTSSQGVKALQQPHIQCGDAATQSSWFNKLSVHKADTSLPAVKPHSSLFFPRSLSLSDLLSTGGELNTNRPFQVNNSSCCFTKPIQFQSSQVFIQEILSYTQWILWLCVDCLTVRQGGLKNPTHTLIDLILAVSPDHLYRIVLTSWFSFNQSRRLSGLVLLEWTQSWAKKWSAVGIFLRRTLPSSSGLAFTRT